MKAKKSDTLLNEFLAILHTKGKTSKEAKAFLKKHKGKDPELDKMLEYTMEKLIVGFRLSSSQEDKIGKK